MTTSKDIEYAYPSKNESRKWYLWMTLAFAVSAAGCLYYALFVGKDLKIRFPGLFKIIFSESVGFLIRLGVTTVLAVFTFFLGQSLFNFMRYDRRRRIVLNDEEILLPIPFDDLHKGEGERSKDSEMFIYYSDVREIRLDEVNSEVTHLRFKVGEISHSIARRRLTDDEFEKVCVHIVSRAGDQPVSDQDS